MGQLKGEDRNRHELEPARDARQPADHPDAAIVGMSEQGASVGERLEQGEQRWLEVVSDAHV